MRRSMSARKAAQLTKLRNVLRLGTVGANGNWRCAQYDGIVARKVRGRSRGVFWMIIVLQIAGIAAVLVGLVTIGIGIPVKEFSFGNTLILSGTVGLCTGLILVGLSVVALELKTLTHRPAAGSRPGADPRARAPPPPRVAEPGPPP